MTEQPKADPQAEQPSEEVKQAQSRGEALLALLLAMAEAKGQAQGRVDGRLEGLLAAQIEEAKNRPITFADAVDALVQQEVNSQILLGEIASLGFDVQRAQRVAALNLELAQHDAAILNPH